MTAESLAGAESPVPGKDATSAALMYLGASKHYFWRWEEEAQVIEWRNGQTLVFRGEVQGVLEALAEEGLPPFGSVLILMAACRSEWTGSTSEVGILQGISMLAGKEEGSESLTSKKLSAYVQDVMSMLTMLHRLPPELRRGVPALSLLAQMVFEPCEDRLSVEDSQAVIKALREGQLDEWLVSYLDEMPIRFRLHEDLWVLRQGLNKLNPLILERRLREGLEQHLKPWQLELPRNEEEDLLTQLEHEQDTASLVRLVRRVLAVMRIPRESAIGGELPVGGIADITNRGTPDRLLLHELAQDSDMLSARIANNEALYWHRESPPAKPKHVRELYLDHGIRFWGEPRLLALATCLGLAQPDKGNTDIYTFAYRPDGYGRIHLHSPQAVREELAVLHLQTESMPHLLRAIAERQKHDAAQVERIWITAELPEDNHPGGRRWSNRKDWPLAFVITISPQGRLRLYDTRHHRDRVIAEALIDVNEVLEGNPLRPPHLQSRKPVDPNGMPAFLDACPVPFTFPITRPLRNMAPIYNRYYDKWLYVAREGRLMMINGKERQARTVFENLPRASRYLPAFGNGPEPLCLMQDEDGTIFLKGIRTRNWKVYCPYRINFFWTSRSSSQSVIFCDESVNLWLNYDTGQISNRLSESAKAAFMERHNIKTGDVTYKKLFIREVYHHKFRSVSFAGELLNFHANASVLSLSPGYYYRIPHGNVGQRQPFEPIHHRPCNQKLWWARIGQTELILDQRGLLHIRRVDGTCEFELSATLPTHGEVSWWRSDGKVCGPACSEKTLSTAALKQTWQQLFQGAES